MKRSRFASPAGGNHILLVLRKAKCMGTGMNSRFVLRPCLVVLVLLGSVLPSVRPCGGQTSIQLSISYQDAHPTNGFFLSWEADAGEQYNLLRTPALGAQ